MKKEERKNRLKELMEKIWIKGTLKDSDSPAIWSKVSLKDKYNDIDFRNNKE